MQTHTHTEQNEGAKTTDARVFYFRDGVSANVSVSHSKCLYISRLSLKSKEDPVIVYKNILHVSHHFTINAFDMYIDKFRKC